VSLPLLVAVRESTQLISSCSVHRLSP
jgi:hypothetical protein